MEAEQPVARSPRGLQLRVELTVPLLLLGHHHLRGPGGGAHRVQGARLPGDPGQPPGGLDPGRDTLGPLPRYLSSSQVRDSHT